MAERSTNNSHNAPAQLVIATAGHVDHGKTSLIKHLTGVETDTLKEEKSRGLSINLGYAYHHFQDANTGDELCLGFVDVPGHIDFIQNMLAGVGGVEHALLVVAADDGIMPQTLEHLAILDLLGVHNISIAITKVDRVDAARQAEVKSELTDLLASHGLDAECFAVDNLSGSGVAELRSHLEDKLRHERLGNSQSRAFNTRFLIDRSFTVKGIGTVVTGTVRSGEVCTEDRLWYSASNEEVRVRGMRLDSNELTRAATGQRAALNITLPHESISRGDWLSSSQNQKPQQRIDVELKLLSEQMNIKSSSQYHLYVGASHHLVNIRPLDSDQSIYQVRSDEPMFCVRGDRFVVRDPAGRFTLGGGQVLDINVPRRGRSNSERISFLEALKNDFPKALSSLIEVSSFGVDPDALASNYNLTPEALEEELANSNIEFVLLTNQESKTRTALSGEKFSNFKGSIARFLDSSHQRQPHIRGVSEPALSKGVDFAGSHLLFHTLIEKLVVDRVIKRSGTLLHLPDHQAAISAEEKEFLNKIRPLLKEAGRVPPRTRELEEMTKIPLIELERILKATSQSKNLIRVADNRYYLPETIMELAEFTEQLARQNNDDEGFSVIQFRDASGIGRNLCIELLEYFDRVGFTRRDGNSRFLRTDKENIFK